MAPNESMNMGGGRGGEARVVAPHKNLKAVVIHFETPILLQLQNGPFSEQEARVS